MRVCALTNLKVMRVCALTNLKVMWVCALTNLKVMRVCALTNQNARDHISDQAWLEPHSTQAWSGNTVPWRHQKDSCLTFVLLLLQMGGDSRCQHLMDLAHVQHRLLHLPHHNPPDRNRSWYGYLTHTTRIIVWICFTSLCLGLALALGCGVGEGLTAKSVFFFFWCSLFPSDTLITNCMRNFLNQVP